VRVIVADDSPELRKLLQIELSLAGHEVVGFAVDGFEAIAKVIELRPDVVVMDVDMPGLDGVTATRAIKGATPETVVYAFTSMAEPQKLSNIAAAGATAAFDKLSLNDLVATISGSAALAD